MVSVAMGGSWMTDFRSASAAAACTFVSFTFVSSTLGRCALSAPASVSAERFAPRTGDCGVSGIVVSAATTVVARGREERCVGVAVSRFRK